VIDLLLLGNSGMMPLPDRWLSSLLVRYQGNLVLFDCGEGTQIPWHIFGWGFRRLEAICFSHWHADHIAGLPGLLHTVANSGRTEPLRIFGPIHTAQIVAGLRVIAPALPFPVEVTELRDGGRFDVSDGLRGHAIASDHRVPGLLFRFDVARRRRFEVDRASALGIPQSVWRRLQDEETVEFEDRVIRPDEVLGPSRRGLAFGYMTDTRPVPRAATFFAGVDLLVCEGTYGDSEMVDKAIRNKHMTYAEAASIARDADARALWLTHFSPGMRDPDAFLGEATSVFPETTVGYSGLTTTLRFDEE
jgi:ribonuclease Z